MTILIKGMEMPKDGRYLVDITSSPNNKVTLCLFMNGYTNAPVCGGALTKVPTPHGRLIDVNTLEADTEWDAYEDGYISYSRLQIDAAPTVIEAEK